MLISILFLLGLSVQLQLCIVHVSGAVTKPNVIFILSDDMGYDDLGFQSHQINTPNLDKFRNEGQFLEWHYAQSVCSPSRAALMTGRYPLHTGINDWIQPQQTFGVPLNNTMLPKILYQNGYDTHMIGKWHLGMFQWQYTPTFRGYKSYYGYYSGGEDYYTHKCQNYYDFRNDMGLECGFNCSEVVVSAYEQYSTPLFSQRAIDVITNHSTNAETAQQPLFLYLAYQSVHSSNNGSSPGECPAQWTEPYDNVIVNNSKRKTFAGMVSCMDDGIGNITQALTKYGFLGDDGNTIVIFSADNGGPTTTGDGIGSSDYPLRGGKHSIWEGGTRVTALIWATPDLIPRTAPSIGQNYTQLMHLVDWLPTLLEAADIQHTFVPGLELDGVSHWQGLKTGNNVPNNDDKFFHFRSNVYYGYDDNSNPKNVAFRSEWHKIFNGSGGNPHTWSPQNDGTGAENRDANGHDVYRSAYTYTYTYTHTTAMGNGNNNNNNELWEVQPVNDNDGGHGGALLAVNIPLYNLSTDYAERHDISADNADLVTDLLSQMQALQATGIPQAKNDPKCSAPVHPTVPGVGQVWQPWC